MVTKKKAGVRLHAIMVRYTPAIWSFLVLIPMVPALSFLNITDPVIWFASIGFTLAGLVFIYDGLVIFPNNKKEFQSVVASFVLFIIGGVNIFFAPLNPHL